ncbi:MAG: hypothetical protein JO190_04540 [Candidatus Eremiobacteraeota bacterium]|nr:hypothetical protein [Candidatus Eremiobacteraeota bacterium]
MLSLIVALAGAGCRAPARTEVAGHYNVPQAKAAPIASGALNAISNGGFETGNIDDGWFQCGDEPSYITREHPHSGLYDEYSGTRDGASEPLGNSGICQAITIPSGGALRAQLYQLSNEANTTFAYQEADLLDRRGNVVVNLYKSVNNKPRWVLGSWNLAAYAGKTYWLYFGVHGDGYAKLATQQFVDDVVLTGSAVPSGER